MVTAPSGMSMGTNMTDEQIASRDADGYREAFYQIADLLGLPAMPISPKEAFETVMLPRLRELLTRACQHPLEYRSLRISPIRETWCAACGATLSAKGYTP